MPLRRMRVTVQPKFFDQVEVAQLLVYHILLGEQQGFNLLHVYEWQFAFFAFAHEDGELV